MALTGRNLSRRGVVAGLLAAAGQAAFANAPARSIIPVGRPAGLTGLAPGKAPRRDILAEIGLPGHSAFVVADARTGEILDSSSPLMPLPTASVAKFVTAQYALDTLGADHRFETRIVATAPLLQGKVDGDLVLIGGGDPMLDTDDLAGMVARLAEAGLREVTGRVLVHRGPLPRIPRIDPGQPDYLSYNPAVSSLNLNFNRVYFEWKKDGADYSVRMDARGARSQPLIPVTQMEVVDRGGPVFAYEGTQSLERWSVARGALGDGGARWLPVRNPGLYAGYALHGLLDETGISAGAPILSDAAPEGAVLASHQSLPLERIMRSMLYYSTNLIAEVAGMNTTLARGTRPGTLAQSAQVMNAWMRDRLGAQRAGFVDHSGLEDSSRVTTRDLVAALTRIGPDSMLAGILRRYPMPKDGAHIEVVGKTGTLNFVSGLAGFAKAGSRDLAFAILAADMETRNAIPREQRERPRGAKGWANRARYQEAQLIMDWARRFG